MTTSDLIAPLSDANDTVRACAAYNLGVIGDAGAVPTLLALRKSRKALDRRAAALALGRSTRRMPWPRFIAR
jgi:HEAT repeat protein